MADIITPDWVQDAVFYHIFPDRFARSRAVPKPANLQPWGAPPTYHGFQGGDLIGVVERLDYLVDLGVNAIYFNPIFQSAANHRYHTHDYYRVDPLLGGDDAFRQLLDAAHARGMRVILDGVFNHASRGFFQFNHILECGPESPYVDWFHINGYPLYPYDAERKPNYRAWWSHPALPEFNTDNPDVRRFLFDVARYWIEFGADGWRLDVPGDIDDDDFWREFRRVVKAADPEAYVVGEVWVNELDRTGERWLQGDQFDAIMNYGFTAACIGFFVGDRLDRALVQGQGHEPIRPLGADAFADQVDVMLGRYAPEILCVQYNLLGSHDTARFLTLAGGDTRLLKLATLFQMTYPGAPSVYYGDEVGLRGRRDPDCRRAMPWDPAAWDTDLLDFFKLVIAVRRSHPALRRGEYVRLYASAPLGVYAFLRRTDDEQVVVVLNNSETAYAVDVPIRSHLAEGTRLRGLLSGQAYVVSEGSLCGPALLPRSGAILLVQGFSI
ncbi:MAG: glycoside hydrolase family 13 protein [Anaerolineae bacterium]|nr:MAG: glycoside hydrolase family 13 protein [Anaerolineae bacterium]